MDPALERRCSRTSEMRRRVRGNAPKLLSSLGLAFGLLCLKGCALSFNDYPEGDLCAASTDAGFHPSTAPDPALRGCDAGASVDAHEDSSQAAAGAAGTDGAE